LNSQVINKDFFAGIFRIDVDKRPSNLAPNPHPSIPTDAGVARFAVPLDNPFVYTSLGGNWNGTYNGITNVSSGSDSNLTTIRTEFWATGLRHAWRMSFDSLTGDLWAGDVGQGTYEEINLIVKGGNYGWVYREGAHNTGFRNPVPAGFTSIDPVYEYVHTGIAGGDAQFKGNSVCGGVVYRGAQLSQSLRALHLVRFRLRPRLGAQSQLRRGDSAHRRSPALTADWSSMGVDPHNQDVLFCDYINGRILRLAGGTVANWFPQTLSDTGAFADLTDLISQSGTGGVRSHRAVLVGSRHQESLVRRFRIFTDTVTHVTERQLDVANRHGLGETLRLGTRTRQSRHETAPRNPLPGEDDQQHLRRQLRLECGGHGSVSRSRTVARTSTSPSPTAARTITSALGHSLAQRMSLVSHRRRRPRTQLQHPAVEPDRHDESPDRQPTQHCSVPPAISPILVSRAANPAGLIRAPTIPPSASNTACARISPSTACNVTSPAAARPPRGTPAPGFRSTPPPCSTARPTTTAAIPPTNSSSPATPSTPSSCNASARMASTACRRSPPP
jgi:hypothetical protein